MLDAKRGAYLVPSEPALIAAHEPSVAETIAHCLGIVRRQIFVVLAFALLGVALGGIFFLRAPPKYTATVTLLAETRKIELVRRSCAGLARALFNHPPRSRIANTTIRWWPWPNWRLTAGG